MDKRQSKVEVMMNWQCNQRCIFCSVGHLLEKERTTKSLEEVKKDLEFAKERGANIISFSGGEPTIRKDIFEAVSYADSLGFEVIEIQSNGRMLKYKDFAERLASSGVNRVLVSIHAPNAELEDFLTQAKGSFDEKVRGLKNLEELGIEKRTSTVINSYNYRLLPELAEFLLQFKKKTKCHHLNFAIPDGFAKRNFKELVPDISKAKPFIEKACGIVQLAGGVVFLHNVYPCIMPKHASLMAELNVSNTVLLGPGFAIDLEKNRKKYRKTGPECPKCRYRLLCPKPWQEYTRERGFSEFKPVKGRAIKPGEIELQDY